MGPGEGGRRDGILACGHTSMHAPPAARGSIFFFLLHCVKCGRRGLAPGTRLWDRGRTLALVHAHEWILGQGIGQ